MGKELTREKALELLRGGEEGVSEFNRLRQNHGGKLDLTWAELFKANLTGAKLTGASCWAQRLMKRSFEEHSSS